MNSAQQIIDRLALQPHPEGGHFRETFRDRTGAGTRAASSAIYYLLQAGERSHWHRIDACEVWHWYAGDPLELKISADGITAVTHVLGNRLSLDQSLQITAPVKAWQSAVTLGAWTLTGCTVAPGFEFQGFEIAALDFTPG